MPDMAAQIHNGRVLSELLRFARGDATPLPGFDEGSYVKAANFDRTKLEHLAQEFEAARRSNLPANELLRRAYGLEPARSPEAR